jgi:hypothetical protein
MNSSANNSTRLLFIVVYYLAGLLCLAAELLDPAEVERKQKVSAESYLLEKELKAGDLEALQPLNHADDLPALYSVLMLSLRNQFGDRSNEIRIAIASKIATIPGHAEYLAGRIDALSTKIYTTRERDDLFYMLQHVKTPETLEVLGRFLFDDRLPEKEIPIEELALVFRP